MPETDYVAFLSYGKDSVAMIHVIVDVLRLPLTRIVTADTMATETLSADWPDVADFKTRCDAEIASRWGIRVEHFVSADKRGNVVTFERCFYQLRSARSKYAGNIYGWPMIGKCYGNNRLKINAFKRIGSETKNAVQYLGIAFDEPLRIARHEKRENVCMPLVDAKWTEKDYRDWCERNGLLSPIYAYNARSGCFFCPEQPLDQLRILRKMHPDLWRLLLRWDKDSPNPFKCPHHKGKTGQWLRDLEERFTREDAQIHFDF